ncbi:MAG: PAS domain S-box protein, partial [Proteobacteria bacterium]|nr:PAS domain S-box protein [Pseudomonadota bacterium]
MIVILTLTLSILLQFVAAFLAFRLIPITGKRLAWSFISVAFVLMALRRCIPLIRILSGDAMIRPDFNAELLALVISILMVIGLSRIASIFLERKRAEEEAVFTAREWQTTFEAANDAIWVLDREQRVLRSNKTAERFFNLPSGSLIGKHCWEIVHKTAKPIPECPLLIARKNLHRETMELQIGTGWFQVTVDPILNKTGQYDGAVHIVSNITERKQAEEALKISEDGYRSLIENQTELVSRFKPDGTFIFVNDVYCRFFGKTREELIGEKWFPLPVDEDLRDIQEELLTLSPTKPIVIIENRLHSYEKDIHWIQFVNKGFFDLHGNLMEIQSVGRDITELKLAEQKIRVLARFPTESPDPILRIDRDGTLLFVNTAGTDQLPEWHLQAGRSAPSMLQDIAIEALNTGSVQLINLEHSKQTYRFSVTPIADAGYANLYGRDTTELKKMEAELFKAQKLESI